jgi:hypothetical protein
MRTARSRTSGEYLVDLFIAPSSQRLEPPENPGRFTKLKKLVAERDLEIDVMKEIAAKKW